MHRLPELTAVYATVDAARSLGIQQLNDGTELVGRVPHVAPQAWLHILFAGLAPEELEQVEQDVGRPLDPALARFLRHLNGLSLFSDSLSISGLRKRNRRKDLTDWQPFSIRAPNMLERPRDAKETYLFVGSYSSDGSRLYIDTVDGRAYRCSRDSAEPLNTWPGFFEMLNREATRIAALFDREGRKLRSTMPTTPPVQQRA
ncbi:MAG: SMI1/KNR4 family protein [Gemmatimonadaceae bacterium]